MNLSVALADGVRAVSGFASNPASCAPKSLTTRAPDPENRTVAS